MRKAKKWLALLLAVSMVSSSLGGFGTRVRAAETIDAGVTVEARYSSNHIRWNAVNGATSYNVLRGATADGDFTAVASSITATEYIDETAGTDTQYYYKIEVAGDATASTAPVCDTYETGIDAIQGHAQLHIDLDVANAENGGRTFDGTNVYSASSADIAKVSGLSAGSIMISYKPKSIDVYDVLVVGKDGDTTIAENGKDTGRNVGVYLNSSSVRINYGASGIYGDFANYPSSLGVWNTITVRSGTYIDSRTGGSYTVAAGLNGGKYNGFSNKSGFFSSITTTMDTLTVGGNKNGENKTSCFTGEIAYVTITDEVLGQTELLAYNAAINEKLKDDETVKAVTLNPTTLDMEVGETSTIQATLTPEKVADPTITWSSSDTTVATVDGEGNVEAVGTGTATITVGTSNPDVTATCEVTVTEPETIVPVTSITLNKTELTLAYVNGAKEQPSETLEATVVPEEATYKTVTWSSDNENVATVDAITGKVTAVAIGETNIIATDYHGAVTATCRVTVTGAASVESKEIYLNETIEILDITGDYGAAVTENDRNIAKVEVSSVPLAQLGTDNTYSGDYINISDCLFTFTPVDGASNTYKVSATTADGKTVYLYHGNTALGAGYPTAEYDGNKAENAYNVVVSKNATNDTFAFNNRDLSKNADSQLYFHYDGQYRFNRQTGLDNNRTYFEMYRPVEGNETSSTLLPGFVQITDLNNISGKQCLIVIKASAGTNYYVLLPTVASSSYYDYVAKVDAADGTAKVGTEISITGTGNGSTTATVGSVQYNITVQSFHAVLDETRPTNISAGAVIGNLSVTDDAPAGAYTYELCDGIGSDDNELFIINANGQLCVGNTALTQSETYKVRVKATSGNASAETALELYALGNGLLYELDTEQTITSGSTVDLTTDKHAAQMMNMEEGTIIVEYISTATSGIQSLFSVGNGSSGNNNRHFHVYITAGDVLGLEIRNNSNGFNDISTTVSGKIKRTYQGVQAKNVIAFKADKAEGVYKLFANGQLVKTLDASTGYKFINDITGVDNVKIGATKRGGSDAYVFSGTVYSIKVYETALSDEEILEETSKVTYPEPGSVFVTPEGTGANYYRIPALITLKSGVVLAAADARFGGTHDSPNNIDIAVVRSEDDGENWSAPEYVFHYADYADNTLDIPVGNGSRINASASFIDPVLLQDGETERVFLIADAMSSGIGSPQAVTGSGYIEIDGTRYMKLKKKGESAYNYVVMGENRDIYSYIDGVLTKTEYSLNANYEVLLNGELQTVKQMSTSFDSTNGLTSVETDVDVPMNIMYSSSEFQALNTTWLYMKYSDDDGKTWSDPIYLNEMVKAEDDRVLVVGPGRGTQITTGTYKGRLVVPVYGCKSGGGWKAGIIYSDDHGITWEYAEGADVSAAAMTETQIVELPDGSLRVFARSNNSKIASAVSIDGGETWTAAEYVEGLAQPSYGSQLSVIRSAVNIDGKPAIILSTPVGSGRNDGRIKIGLITDTGVEGVDKYDIEWKYDFEVDSPGIGFSYSCLTNLEDGSVGILYEKYDSYASGQLQNKHAVKYEEFTMSKLMGGEVVTVIANGNGNGIVSEKTLVLAGNEITVTATPEENYNFVKWVDDKGNTLSEDAEYTFTTTADITVTAVFEEKPTVVVSIESVVNDSVIANIASLTGGGVYHIDNKVTVTASAKVGYEFKGWYVQSAVGTDYVTNGELISKDYSHSFVVDTEEDVNLVAVYVSTTRLLLTITDTNNVTVDGTPATENVYKEAGKVTVAYTGENFLYWKNASGKIVSTEATYEFSLVNNTTLIPVVKSAETGSALVEFVNEYNQILSVSTWDQGGSDELATTIPSKLGFDFKGWALETASTTVVDAATVRTAITNGATYIRLVPIYEKAATLCKVAYQDGTSSMTAEVALGEVYTVTAGTVNGQTFNCWKMVVDEGENIVETVVSYNPDYTFLVTGDVTLTAVFTATAVEKASILEITSQYEIKNGETVEKVAFVASREIAEDYTLLEHGMLYAKDSDIIDAEVFVEGADGVSKFTASGIGTKGALTLNVRIGNATSSIKARAYAIVKNNETGAVETIYSTVSTYVIQ